MSNDVSLSVKVSANLDQMRARMVEATAIVDTTSSAMRSMANAYDGTKTIANANAAMLQVQQMGGVTKLTDADMARLNATLTEGLAKYGVLGREAPAAMVAMAEAVKRGREEVQSFGVVTVRGAEGTEAWTSQLHAFDGVLAALGIHIGPEIKGLTELGAAGGAAAGSLGLIATAGLALGAGIGGWKLGRLVADFFDLDTTIGNATAKLLGFGDVAGQTAAAAADKLAEASRRAGYAITDLDEATRKLNEGVKLNYDHLAIANGAVAGWQREIRKLREDGDLPQLTADLASQNFEIDKLSTQYGISVKALQYYQREQAKTAEAAKQAAADVKQAKKEMGDAEKELQDITDPIFAKILDDYAKLKAAIQATIDKEYEAVEAQQHMESARQATLANTLHAALYGSETDFAGNLQEQLAEAERQRGTGVDVDQLERDLIEQERRRQAGEGGAAGASGGGGTAPGGSGGSGGGGGSVGAGFDSGRGFSGDSGRADALWSGMYPHAPVEPFRQTGGPASGPTHQINLYVTQPLGTPQAIADVVGNAMKTVIQQGR